MEEEYPLEDEFGRSLEEQLQDNIQWNYWVDRDQHRIHENYVSDDYLQDGDVPFGTYVTFEDGGPQFRIEDPYLAPGLRDKAVELLDDSYEALLQYFE